MRKILFVAFVGILLFQNVCAQKIAPGPAAKELVEITPQEKIFLHYNSPLLFPGEYLLYKVYNLNEENRNSEISTVAYVELIGEEGNRIFRQKVKLDDAKGQADFFVPTSVPSGNYKLVAYTNWMKNSGNFYSGDITIINPYRGRRANAENTETAEMRNEQTNNPTTVPVHNAYLALNLNKEKFAPREQVVLNLNQKDEAVQEVSISVRKLSELNLQNPETAQGFVNSNHQEGEKPKDAVYLPELRGQLYQGKLVALNSAEKAVLKNKKIAVSVPSEGLVPKTAVTDEHGNFFFDLDKNASAETAVLEVLGEERENYEVQLVDEPGIDPSDLNFSTFRLSADMQELILRRSVHNQIENSYFAVKPDTVVTTEGKELFYDRIAETYNLDDYTRFKTVPETFVEIINAAWIRKDKSGKSVVAVRGRTDNIEMNLLPLVSVDGILVQDHEDFINMNPRHINKINLIRDKIYVGAEVFQGAVLVETRDENYLEQHVKPYATKVDLMRPEIRKKYFRQNYDQNSNLSRIPDYRYQLLWEPELRLEKEEQELSFYTSDVPGTYEISIEGFTTTGKPVSLRKTFVVAENK